MDSRSGEMAVFVRVVQSGSFSAASNALDMTPSAVSKLITRLEERLGVVLFHRSTRELVVTPEGRSFYDSCVRILDDLEEAEHAIGVGSAEPRGLLRVNATIPFGTHQLIPLLPEFYSRYPGIVLDLSLNDALIDLQREQVDLAIRMGPLADAGFKARFLGQSRRVVAAAPSYLHAHGIPRTPADLAKHSCLNFNFRRSMDEWPFMIDGQITRLAVAGGMLTNNGETMRELTLRGLGISRLGHFHVERDLRAGSLVELLPDYNAGDLEQIHAIFPAQRYMPKRLRAFIDFLVERISPHLQQPGQAGV